MEVLDQVVINFSPDKLFFLNICLGFLLFGVALDITLSDFKKVVQSPKSVFVGLIGQLILMPILTIILIFILKLPVSLSLGMILVAACPGGNVSNYAVHMAKANTVLSVLLTSISTLAAIVITPLYFSQLAPLVPDSEALRKTIYVAPWDMVFTILKLIVLPLIIGMSMNTYFPAFTQKVKGFVKAFSLIIFLGIVIVATLGNIDNIKNYLDDVFYIVLIHNAAALMLGYYWAKIMGLNIKDVRAISLETGLQNTGLALILIFNFFNGLGGMALVAACWGIWHMVSGFALASYWSKRS